MRFRKGVRAIPGHSVPPDALLFFPAAGKGNNGNLNNAGTNGNYWSSTLNSDNTDNAYNLNFNSGNVNPQNNNNRYNGFSVRPLSASIGQLPAFGYIQGILPGQIQQAQHIFTDEVRKKPAEESHLSI